MEKNSPEPAEKLENEESTVKKIGTGILKAPVFIAGQVGLALVDFIDDWDNSAAERYNNDPTQLRRYKTRWRVIHILTAATTIGGIAAVHHHLSSPEYIAKTELQAKERALELKKARADVEDVFKNAELLGDNKNTYTIDVARLKTALRTLKKLGAEKANLGIDQFIIANFQIFKDSHPDVKVMDIDYDSSNFDRLLDEDNMLVIVKLKESPQAAGTNPSDPDL